MSVPERGRGRIAVGVSGAGSNLRALVRAAGRGSLAADIVLVFADRPCPALDWAAEQGIETALLPFADGAGDAARTDHDATLAVTLRAIEPDLVVLAGYLRLVGPAVLEAFRGRIVNTHPSLLPAFQGAHAVRDALANGSTVTGATIHLVDETLDGGPILAQEAVAIRPDDDEAALVTRIQAVEHRLLPGPVDLLLAGAIAVRAAGRPSTQQRRTSSHCPAGPSCPSPTRPAWPISPRASTGSASSSSQPATPPGRSARRACR